VRTISRATAPVSSKGNVFQWNWNNEMNWNRWNRGSSRASRQAAMQDRSNNSRRSSSPVDRINADATPNGNEEGSS
jgi:hypothetical protein